MALRPEMQVMADAVIETVKKRYPAIDSEAFGQGIGKLVKEMIAPLQERIEALEAAPLKYLGTHETGRMYQKNAVVTHDGSMWIALRTTQQNPGPGDGWQLCVKRGRDAR